MFKETFLLTDEEKHKVSEMSGKIMLWILEGRDIGYMSRNLRIPPWQVKRNIDEMLYTLRKEVGIKHYLKLLTWK